MTRNQQELTPEQKVESAKGRRDFIILAATYSLSLVAAFAFMAHKGREETAAMPPTAQSERITTQYEQSKPSTAPFILH